MFDRARLPRTVLAALLAATLLPASVADAQEKKYGYDSKAGGGKGAEFTAAEKTKITDALDKIKNMTFTTKAGTYKGTDIDKNLRKMLDDGRMGKGVGADKKVGAITSNDLKATTEGDKINVADHYIKDADNKNLTNALVHEWLHTTQTDSSSAKREAPAYQLGLQVYLDKGGAATDAPAKLDTKLAAKFKKLIEDEKVVVPDSKVPAEGAENKRSLCGHEYTLEQDSGRVYFWSSTLGYVDSVVANPNQMFFTFLSYPTPPNCDRLLIFGADLSTPSNPAGTLTVVDANASGFISRSDHPLFGLKYPFSATRDSNSLKIYVLDAHFGGPGIVSLLDVDEDLIPDLMQPFAPRGFPGVDSAEAVVWAEPEAFGPGLAVFDLDRRGISNFSHLDPVTLLRDVDLNGQADIAIELVELYLASFPPHFTTRPLPEQLQVEVQGMPGHGIQIMLTDASGDASFGVIGSGIAPPDGAPFFIPLLLPLVDQQFIKAVDVTDNTQGPVPTQVATPAPGVSAALLAGLAASLAGAGAIAVRRRRARSDP